MHRKLIYLEVSSTHQAFSKAVLPSLTDLAHADLNLVFDQKLGVEVAGVWHPLIGVVN
jgi:hypothetical protein